MASGPFNTNRSNEEDTNAGTFGTHENGPMSQCVNQSGPQSSASASQRPSYSDWQRWRPMIKAVYRSGTARMVLSRLQSEGFDVTEKMLRERLRKWHLNTKNKRRDPSKCSEDQSRSGKPAQQIVPMQSGISTLERPLPTNVDEVYERRILCSVDHLLEDSWSTHAGLYEGHRLVNLLITLENAMKLARDNQSPAAWAKLKNAGIELKDASWSRISPRNIIYLIRIIGYWGLESDDMLRGLRTSVKSYVSTVIGDHHPIASIMDGALRRKLSVESYLMMFTLATTKADAKPLSWEDKDDMAHYARLSYIKILWYFREYKRMEDVLNTWTPTTTSDKCYKLRRLAQAKFGLGQYCEAEELYKAALGTVTAVHQLIDIISGYVWSVFEQDRPTEAVEVFIRCIPTYDQVSTAESDASERAIRVEWICNEAAFLQQVTGSDQLSAVVARLRADSDPLHVPASESLVL